MALSRRNFLTLAGAGAATFALASLLRNYYVRATTGQSLLAKGFGELIPDPNGILDLPKRFQYRILSQTGKLMSDNNPVPTSHDGMAAFPGKNGATILVRNHELSPGQTPAVMAANTNKYYDRRSSGGTTTLIVDKDRQTIEEFVSLAGTNRNCSGGSTPWGSWISCEEDDLAPQSSDLSHLTTESIKHGYNFEVFADGKISPPLPLVAMGRFRHEAIAVAPKTGYIYQTEDREDSCIYRFRPKQNGNLKAGGILEALVIKDMPAVNTSLDFPMGNPKKVEWVKIEEVDPEKDTLRYEAQSKGAAIFRRGEGICFGNGEIYWTCTNGGKAGTGQIFRYNLASETVELFVESPGMEVLDYPDNLILTPFGHLMVCEDGLGEQFLVGITPEGEYYHFARNAFNNSEFAGICFAPDGQTMFVNIYDPGITLAIWGEWNQT
ncbi:putative phosphatase [Pleurocapsa sp. PCC 7327]|uniref:alkaline phosphatase PhoX n=1 Tax=Pleurocapsa sp. PCC 7327 TaxID=118163 RepID=UPI00029FCFA8|nr:alkaline phosphatase PhoX [Pleurocapsa sp. PCC 7327]AFY76531.1 putative phosphatase [Pleurocapsa sp. PCC 7327]